MSEETEKKQEHHLNPRKILIAGAAFGGAMAVVISLLMDFMFAGSMNGTWRDAIASDFKLLFSITISPEGLMAYLMFFVVLLVMAAVGAAMGFVFAYIIYKFLSFLTS